MRQNTLLVSLKMKMIEQYCTNNFSRKSV